MKPADRVSVVMMAYPARGHQHWHWHGDGNGDWNSHDNGWDQGNWDDQGNSDGQSNGEYDSLYRFAVELAQDHAAPLDPMAGAHLNARTPLQTVIMTMRLRMPRNLSPR